MNYFNNGNNYYDDDDNDDDDDDDDNDSDLGNDDNVQHGNANKGGRQFVASCLSGRDYCG